MTYRSLAALSLAASLSLTAIAAASAGAKHDGTWSVQMVTDSGLCDRSYSYSIAIQDGNVRYLSNPGDKPTRVSGQIGPNGNVDLDIHRSVAKVDALGTIASTFSTGTNDVWVVRGPDREHLIPVIADVVRTIDASARRVVIEPLPGLLD